MTFKLWGADCDVQSFTEDEVNCRNSVFSDKLRKAIVDGLAQIEMWDLRVSRIYETPDGIVFESDPNPAYVQKSLTAPVCRECRILGGVHRPWCGTGAAESVHES
jgi:hypothetical protein